MQLLLVLQLLAAAQAFVVPSPCRSSTALQGIKRDMKVETHYGLVIGGKPGEGAGGGLFGNDMDMLATIQANAQAKDMEEKEDDKDEGGEGGAAAKKQTTGVKK
eukprot:TRINITY_DN3887_c0_g1_i2.p1 TRINITY_DN3887_c0_g1~~TRINITY_DN3887_c0_g1_i2.p1  ORF type:complete len:104 (+),score=24.69 TRINITY_DN3887_c0_g1_i2:665-976(+)